MKTNNKTWKPVTIGGFTGILMGAGAMHISQSVASAASVDEGEQMPELKPLDELSFREAFDTARAEMGPGGVFRWHGNLYNTYTADEWQAMSDERKEELAQEVDPEISPEDIDTDVVTVNETADSLQTEASETSDPLLSEASEAEDDSDDVRVIGQGEVTLQNGRNVTVQELEVNGQRVAVIDVDQDGTADIAMTDLNHNRQMDEGEVIDLHTGEALSFTNDEQDISQMPENLDL